MSLEKECRVFSLVDLLGCWDFNFLPTNGFSIKPPKVKLLAGEQKATKFLEGSFVRSPEERR